MSDNHVPDRRRPEVLEEAERGLPQKLLKTPTKQVGEAEDETQSPGNDANSEEVPPSENLIDIADAESDNDIEEIVMPAVTSSGEVLCTPTKVAGRADPETPGGDDQLEEIDPSKVEKVFSSFPCQVIPETLTRLTRTPPEGEHLEVHKKKNGRLRIYVRDHFTKFSPYSNSNHKPCTVCMRVMRGGEMHLNFPADLDRRRIWANLLGFKYKDILRSKMGPVSFSIAAGPICTEHFAEECFRNHNFNKAAIEAFGVPVAISPDVKTTPSKKSSSRVPWVCTICEFHSCSVVELQLHLLEHTEQMLKKKEGIFDVPEAGFMCPFCRKCTYGYKTISGFRRHLNSAPIHHCHLRRIYEFAKMNCRSSELDPVEKWDNWTRRNVYVAYHGCEPPANEVVLTPSPTKSCNPEERTRQVHDDEKRRKAVRSLAFVGKEGGTSVNDHNVMQRAVYLQVRRNLEHKKRYPDPDQDEDSEIVERRESSEKHGGDKETLEPEDVDQEKNSEPSTASSRQSSQVPLGSTRSMTTRRQAASAISSPVKPSKPSASLPNTPAKKKRKLPSEEPESPSESIQVTAEDRARQEKIRDEEFAKMIQKRSQQVKRLIHAKQLKKDSVATKKPRKALAYNLAKSISTAESSQSGTSEAGEEEVEEAAEPPKRKIVSEEPSPPAAKPSASKPREPTPKPIETAQKEEERPLKSMLARSFAAGQRPSMAKYQMSMDEYSSGPIGRRSLSSGSSIAMSSSLHRPMGSSGPSTSGSHEIVSGGSSQDKGLAKRPILLSRRPIILSPRKRPLPSSAPSDPNSQLTHQPLTHHESSPIIPAAIIDSSEMQLLIPGKDIDVELVEEVIEELATSEDITSFATSSDSKPIMTLAEALGGSSSGSAVKDQELEEISKELTKESTFNRCMEDASKFRTVSKMRAEMRVSRHCIRQIEAARARARLFGEGEDNVHIYYSDDGAQVISKHDPKWREMQQQHQEVVEMEEVSSSQEAAEQQN